MTKIDNSTQSVLAAITAKNSWQPVTTHNRAALPDIIATESSLPPRETKRTKALKKQLHKTKEEKPAKKFEEPNITRLQGREGIVSYRVQIRKRVDGTQHSLTKTFRHLPNAKNWRNKKFLDIEVNGFPIQIVTETSISDIGLVAV